MQYVSASLLVYFVKTCYQSYCQASDRCITPLEPVIQSAIDYGLDGLLS